MSYQTTEDKKEEFEQLFNYIKSIIPKNLYITDYEFDGKKCRDQEEYDKLVKDVFDKRNYMKIEFQLFSSDNHLQELLDFIENY